MISRNLRILRFGSMNFLLFLSISIYSILLFISISLSFSLFFSLFLSLPLSLSLSLLLSFFWSFLFLNCFDCLLLCLLFISLFRIYSYLIFIQININIKTDIFCIFLLIRWSSLPLRCWTFHLSVKRLKSLDLRCVRRFCILFIFICNVFK